MSVLNVATKTHSQVWQIPHALHARKNHFIDKGFAGDIDQETTRPPASMNGNSMSTPRRTYRKVRTGCQTCKARKVKCDETKPACLRCTTAKYVCGGYKIELFANKRHEAAISLAVDPTRRNIRPSDSVQFYRTLQSFVNMPPSDYRAYDFCRRYTIHDMASHHLNQFWTRTVMSACHSEPAILHAALAVAGAHKAYCDKQSGESDVVGVSSLLTTSTFSHYDQALWYLKKLMAVQTPQQYEAVLIVCLVLLTFDMIAGRYGEAHLHLIHGRRIIKDINNRKSDDVQVPLILPPAPSTTMDEINYSFALMDIQSVNFGSMKSHFHLVADSKVSDGCCLEIPMSFTNLDDAWRHMLLLFSKCYSLFDGINALGSRKYELLTDDLGFRDQQRLHLAELAKWKEAFDNSSVRTMSTPRSCLADKAGIKATLLKIQHLTLHVCLSAALNVGNEMFYDTLTPKFGKLVELCEDLLPSLATITVEIGIIQPLFLAGCLCRHPVIRRRILHLLSRARKEGYWDSKLIGMITRERMVFEEELAGYVYDAEQPPLYDVDLALLIPRDARWSESWMFFVADDYSVAEVTFRRRKLDLQLLIEGEDEHETRTKLVNFK